MNSDLIRLLTSRLRATNGSFAFSHGLVFLGAAKDAENRWPKPQFEYVVLHQSSGGFAGASAHTVLELRSANAACCSILLPRYRRQDGWLDQMFLRTFDPLCVLRRYVALKKKMPLGGPLFAVP